MIHQFAELGQFYLQKEVVKDQLVQFASDPAAKFRSKEILMLVFSPNGFEGVQVEEYDERRRVQLLYRQGPPNRWDPTPTTGMARVKKGHESEADGEIGKKLTRIGRSIREAVDGGENLADWERNALAVMRDRLLPPGKEASKSGDQRAIILNSLREARPDLTQSAILTVGWRTPKDVLRWVGDFQAFQLALVRTGGEAASKNRACKYFCVSCLKTR